MNADPNDKQVRLDGTQVAHKWLLTYSATRTAFLRQLDVVQTMHSYCHTCRAPRQQVSWQPVDMQRMLRRGAASGDGPPDDWGESPTTPQPTGEIAGSGLPNCRLGARCRAWQLADS